jgi:hypothetical protein
MPAPAAPAGETGMKPVPLMSIETRPPPGGPVSVIYPYLPFL